MDFEKAITPSGVAKCEKHGVLAVRLQQGRTMLVDVDMGQSEITTIHTPSNCDWQPYGPTTRERSPKFPCLGLVKPHGHREVYVFKIIFTDRLRGFGLDGVFYENLHLDQCTLITDNPDYPPDPKLVELFAPKWVWPEVLKGYRLLAWDAGYDWPVAYTRAICGNTRWCKTGGNWLTLDPHNCRDFNITLPPKPADWRTPVLNPNWKEPVE